MQRCSQAKSLRFLATLLNGLHALRIAKQIRQIVQSGGDVGQIGLGIGFRPAFPTIVDPAYRLWGVPTDVADYR